MFLFKTEPEEYSFDRLIDEGKTVWNGVKNPLAQKFLKSVKKGDLIFIYHTGKEKQIVGLAKAVSGPYIYEDGLYVVDVAPLRKLSKPLKLSDIKKMPEFKDFYLVRMPRLSVMPVSENLAQIILKLASDG
ncbi:MAG: EVE domain-containing protein [Hydrogenothermaceae bacterium]|nr:EVE domain-containing protein [Hydrogenothermaceae bacterium]